VFNPFFKTDVTKLGGCVPPWSKLKFVVLPSGATPTRFFQNPSVESAFQDGAGEATTGMSLIFKNSTC